MWGQIVVTLPILSLQYQSPAPPPSYGYGYQPQYSYESYEYSRTPRKAKLRKVYSYTPQYSSYSYGYTPKIDSWEAEYYYDACHVSLQLQLLTQSDKA